MTTKRRKEEIAASLKLLATTYVQAVRQLERQLEETMLFLSRELDIEATTWIDHLLTVDPIDLQLTAMSRPIADRLTLSIRFQEKSCFLGNTLLFRFFEVISRSPNRYFTHSELLEEVWEGPRSESSIRSVAKRLRDRLVAVGLDEVAQAIDGSIPGYFSFRWN